jgi:hypothetical protein
MSELSSFADGREEERRETVEASGLVRNLELPSWLLLLLLLLLLTRTKDDLIM